MQRWKLVRKTLLRLFAADETQMHQQSSQIAKVWRTIAASPSVLNHQGANSNSSSRWERLAFSTALAAAATAVSQSAECKAAKDDESNISDVSVQSYVDALWQEIDEQLSRLDAQSTITIPHLPKPTIEFSKPEGSVTVSFHVPQSLNINAAIYEIRRALKSFPRLDDHNSIWSSGSSVSEQRASGSDGTSIRFTKSGSLSSRSSRQKDDETLVIDVLVPYDRMLPATIEFSGRANALNLDIMSRVMHRAATPSISRIEDGSRPWLGNHDSSDSGVFGNLPVDPFLRHFLDMIENFDRLQREDGSSIEGNTDNSFEEQQRRLRRPKSFDGETLEEEAEIQNREMEAAVRKLRSLGAQVFLPQSKEPKDGEKHATLNVDWGALAGYEDQKRQIEDTLLLPLVRPDVYDNVAKGTREKFAINRPRALLFTGPPGTGKTSSARIIASHASVALVYIPLEALVSKWYGESEKHLAEALKACDALPDGCVLFLDELDALATQRGSGDMHEATRRLLGVLLRHLDGFDSSRKSVVVGATNRPQDLDPALLSRFSTTITFGLPDERCREQILARYAHQLSKTELAEVAKATPNLSGRDLRDICEQTERRWAAKIVRGIEKEGKLPPLSEYMSAAKERVKSHFFGRK